MRGKIIILLSQIKMSEFSQQGKNRLKTQNGQNISFKSGIFQRKQSLNPNPKDSQQTKSSFQNPFTGSQFSPYYNQPVNNPFAQSTQSRKAKTSSRPMFNSSMFGTQSKSSGGSLFQMGRTVDQRNDNLNIQEQKQKNKYSFLQIPKLNSTNSPYLVNSQFKGMGASMMFKRSEFVKSPSFLKKDTKSNGDSNEERQEAIFKITQINKSTSKNSQASQKKALQSDTNTPETFSPFLMKVKITSHSPMNSSDSKNQSTNQPKESSSNNTLLDPKMIPMKGENKGSFIFSNDKQFYTPTEKNSTKLGLTNFIQKAEKYNSTYNGTVKNLNQKKTSFFEVQELRNNRLSPNSPNNNESDKKTQIPSFIKFKEKRNEIEKKLSENATKFNFSNQHQNQNVWTVQNFEIKQRLGKGSFGDVFLARQKKSGFFCVLKKLSKNKIKSQNTQELIMRQIKIQSFLVHRHITNLYGFFDDQEFVYLIMEYMSDGSVAQRFNRRKVPQKQVALIVRQICDGLKYMHIENIIHRDIKPENVFIHEEYIKLGDFGCSVFSDSKRNTMVGSLAYFSPEQLKNQSYDEKIDVWSVGVLCYELLTGKSPFQEDIMKIARQQNQVKLSQLRFPSKVQLSEEAKDFTRRLLQEKPENRLSIIETLKHPFIVKNNLIENIYSSQVGI